MTTQEFNLSYCSLQLVHLAAWLLPSSNWSWCGIWLLPTPQYLPCSKYGRFTGKQSINNLFEVCSHTNENHYL